MFKFNQNTYSHMPFVAYGKAPQFTPKYFCCLMIEGKWKLHYFDGNAWLRINTQLPDDTTECSPTAEYNEDTNKWIVSFIAGGYEADRKIYLYKIDDLENPIPQKVCQADVGYIWKNRTVSALRKGCITIANDMQTKILTLSDNVEYLYRLSYNPNNPNEILISGQFTNGNLFSWACDLHRKTLYEITADGNVAYKACFFDNKCYYAYRNDSDGYEDRHIVEATNISKAELDFGSHIKIEIKENELTNLQMAKNLANATIRFAKSGFKLADDKTLEHRNSICSTCEFWQSSARFGLGKCLKCGCTSAKLYLDSESCPINKW